MRSLIAWMGVVAFAAGAATGAELLDLSSLDDLVAPRAAARSVWDDTRIASVAAGSRLDEPRFYLTGLLGESFATLTDPLYADLAGRGSINRSVITAGAAAGVAIEREDGRLRLEVEGRARDDLTAAVSEAIPGLAVDLRCAAADGWSTMLNAWRDYSVSERVDLYLGGGVGGGGYRYDSSFGVSVPGVTVAFAANTQRASFAWQLGGGVVWNLSERVAFDLGYRFFAIDRTSATLVGTINGVPTGLLVPVQQQFTASELLFGLRIYEPFRRWQ